MSIRWPTCSASQFADLVGVSAQTLVVWMDAGMPSRRGKGKGHPSTIDIKKALPWVISRREPPGSERERLAKEQADKVALENSVKRGELIYADQVADALSRLAADLAARHDALPGRVAGELAGLSDPAAIRARLLDETRAIRTAFADATDQLADALGSDEDGGVDPASAPKKGAARVGRRKPRAAARKRRARPVSK